MLTWGSQVSVAPGRDGGTSQVDAYASPFRAPRLDVPRARSVPRYQAWPAASFYAAAA
jgi:hypothetical protein